jgi:UDP-N-acetylmuramoylalanine--D-glutamate ligase
MLPDHPFRDYRGRRVTVLGLGSFGGGVGAVRFLVERGAVVTITDTRTESQLAEAIRELQTAPPMAWRLGGHHEADFANADLIVVNPAVRRDQPLLKLAQSHGIPLTSEMNLFWQHQRGTICAVTGSNGKSTTTAMLHAILTAKELHPPHPRPLSRKGRGETEAGRVWRGGNIGGSLHSGVDAIQPGDVVVLELSSFQLADLERLQVSPQIAVVTNFAANHLDWHKDLAHYRWAKQTILRWQADSDVAVQNADDPDVRTWPVRGRRILFGFGDHGSDGTFLRGDRAVWRLCGIEQEFPIRDWLKLPGRHNLANALAASAAALCAGAALDAVRQGLENYAPLPHRLEFVAEIDGRRFYNDSLATTPESAIAALEAFDETVVLLAGGYDKGVDHAAFAECIARRAKAVALMGQTAAALRNLIVGWVENVGWVESSRPTSFSAEFGGPRKASTHPTLSPALPDFESAFRWAWKHSAPGDVILLSPGCASYGWFRNFADRGEQFKTLVRQLGCGK